MYSLTVFIDCFFHVNIFNEETLHWEILLIMNFIFDISNCVSKPYSNVFFLQSYMNSSRDSNDNTSQKKRKISIFYLTNYKFSLLLRKSFLLRMTKFNSHNNVLLEFFNSHFLITT